MSTCCIYIPRSQYNELIIDIHYYTSTCNICHGVSIIIIIDIDYYIMLLIFHYKELCVVVNAIWYDLLLIIYRTVLKLSIAVK